MEIYSQRSFKSNKKKSIEKPNFILSLDFSNNSIQTFILDLFEQKNTRIDIENIIFNNEKMMNLIMIKYKENYTFLQLYDSSFLSGSISNRKIFKTAEILKSICEDSGNVIFLFLNIKKKDYKDINEISFILKSCSKIKIYHCSDNYDLYDYLVDLISSISLKEEKSKLTFFDLKPVTNSNLSELDDLSENSRIWVKHLMCIPGISEKKAIAIVKMYPTFKSLIEVYESEEFTELEKEKFLKDITIIGNANSSKRIGEAVSSKVYKYFTEKEGKKKT